MHRLTRGLATLLILIAWLQRPAVADAPTSRPTFTTVDEVWHDAARNRDVPVLLYLPTNAAKPTSTIIVSHGLGDTRFAMSYACTAWAADGFVVVALQHIGSDDSIWKGIPPGRRFGAIYRAATQEQFLLRCGDVRFAMDELAKRTNRRGNLAGRIDLDHLGLAGHSFGALTAQAMIGEHYAPDNVNLLNLTDDRIKAAILMSPGIEGVVDASTAFANVHVPTFHFTGTADVVTGLGNTTAKQRRLPFDRMVGSDRYLMIFERGDHMVFSGHRPPGIDDARYDRIQAATARLSTPFWELTLRGDPTAAARLERDDRTGLVASEKVEHHPPTTRPTQ